MRRVDFDYLAHLVVVPVAVDGVERRFVLDSGIGVTLVRESVAAQPTGRTYTGRRMSGQAVDVPLAVVGAFGFGGETRRDVDVGVLDMSGFPPALADVDGFLSLTWFEDAPLTVDYASRALRVDHRVDGTAVAARVDRDGPSVTMFMPLTLPDGTTIETEVDMGSDCLILDERFAGLRDETAGSRVVDGVDETGHSYRRTFTRLRGGIQPAGAPGLAQPEPEVQFQAIIHDGLVGHAFLSRRAVTFDVGASELVFGPAG